MDTHVRITEVGPRDGLQSETATVPTDQKIELVRACAPTGINEIEVSSFVSPRWIPQLGDAARVFLGVARDKPDGVLFSALVPNIQGFEAAIEVNRKAQDELGVERLIEKVSVFTAASETFSLKNTNATIEETLIRFAPVVERARGIGLRTRGYISCAFECPFEGPILPEKVAGVVAGLIELGVDEIDLGDTIGKATPQSTQELVLQIIEALDGEPTNRWGEPTLTLHLHDTFGHAADCVRMALDLGVRSFDASVGGLGGCPYASVGTTRAPGNISTSALVRAITEAGFTTDVDPSRLAVAEATASRVLSAARMNELNEPDSGDDS
ncbi:MAG: hydroxymethylglutaryl-CoA lyase [Phycisphaerales bacterium]|jgi:hydroxymethylglutaryl-CoA lyase